jgi:hypothetical protein
VSCGGGDDNEDGQKLLDKAFNREIKSADLKVDGQLEVKGSEALNKPIRVQASGPFRGNAGKLPSVDLELNIGTGGGGQTVSTGFVSTGDRAFVKFQDAYYEQPRSEVAKTNRTIARNGRRRSSLEALGLDPRSWLSESKEEGDEEVAGVETTHVSGKVDVARVVSDFNQFVKKSGGAIGGTTGQSAPQPLSDAELDKIKSVVKDPTFDVYVGKDDDIVRRVAGRLEFEVPEQDRTSVGGIEGGSLDFSIEFADVNGDQEVEAPSKARPLSDLTRTLGAGALGGLGGSGGGGSGSGGGFGSGGSGGSGSGGTPTPPPTTTGPDAEAFRKYADCLDKANPRDTDALQRCSQLLQ